MTKNAGFSAIFCLLMICLILASCGEKSEKVLVKDEMIQVYADVLTLSVNLRDRENKDIYFEKLDSVLSIHGIGTERFFSSLDYYQKDPLLWRDLIKKVITELEKRRDQPA